MNDSAEFQPAPRVGLSVGLSFVGRAWSEPKLLALAFDFEQTTKARRPPTFRASADLSEAPALTR